MKAQDKFGLIRLLLYLFLLSLCLSRAGFSQGVRFGDGQPLWTTIKLTGGTALTTVANAKVNVCTAPANAVPCTNYATTYTDSSATVTCSNTTQVTLAGSSTCVANGDQFGNWGVWLAAPSIPTQFVYTVTAAGISYGPFPFTIGQQTGGGAAIPGAVYATNYPSLQAAVDGAGATGAVIIPSNYLGTDTFTNAGNISIIDFRAGRQSFFNIRNWGAKVDGATDDSAAIQATIDYAESFPLVAPNNLAGAAIYIPPGTTLAGCGNPIRIHKQGIAFTGAGRTTSLVGPSNTIVNCAGLIGPWIAWAGPASYVTGTPMNFNGTALLTGGTSALQVTANNYTASFIDLRDCPSCSGVNGNAQFAVEATVKPTALPTTGPLIITSSSGQRDSIATPTRAFDLYLDSGGQVTGRLNVAGTLKTVASGATVLSPGSTYHLALTYDGTTVRLFINGVSVGTPQAASGTITQALTEAVHIGCDAASTYPDGCGQAGNGVTVGSGGFYGVIDGYRLSNTARYTAGFTPPTAKWGTADSSTLVECNFTQNYEVFTTCQRGTPGVVNTYLPVHRTDFCPGGTQSANIHGIGFTYGGIYINPGLGVEMDSIGVFNSTGNGIMIPGVCNFASTYSNFWFAGSGANLRYDFYAGTGISRFSEFRLNGGAYQFIGPMASHLDNFFVNVDANSVIPVMIKGVAGNQNYTKIETMIDDAEAVANNLVTPLLLDGPLVATIENSDISNQFGPAGSYPIIVQGNAKTSFVRFAENLFITNASSAARVHFVPTPGNQFPTFPSPLHFLYNTEFLSPNVPWTDATNALFNDRQFGTQGTVPYTFSEPNDTVTGTYPTLLVKYNTHDPSQAIISTAGDTEGVVGIAVERDQQNNLVGTGTAGNVDIAFGGKTPCTFDGATTAGHYVQISATFDGACTDAGATPPAADEIIGRVTATTAVMTAGTAPATAINSGGSLAAGTYKVCYTVINIAGGESVCGTEATVTTTGSSGRISVSAIVNSLSPARFYDGMAGFRVYITAAGGSGGTETLQVSDASKCTGGVVAFAHGITACGLGGGYNATSLVVGVAVPGGNTAGRWAPVEVAIEKQ